MTILPHTPYLLDLVPSYFGLFPIINVKLKDRRFHKLEEIQVDSQAELDT